MAQSCETCCWLRIEREGAPDQRAWCGCPLPFFADNEGTDNMRDAYWEIAMGQDCEAYQPQDEEEIP